MYTSTNGLLFISVIIKLFIIVEYTTGTVYIKSYCINISENKTYLPLQSLKQTLPWTLTHCVCTELHVNSPSRNQDQLSLNALWN